MRWMLLGLLVVGAFAAGLLVVACGSGGESTSPSQGQSAPATATKVNVGLDEWSVRVEGTARPGLVNFEVDNKGSIAHELIVLKTDLGAAVLPVTGGKVDEEAAELKNMGEVEELAAGGTGEGAFELESGHYVLICNISRHYEQGMRAEMTVQ